MPLTSSSPGTVSPAINSGLTAVLLISGAGIVIQSLCPCTVSHLMASSVLKAGLTRKAFAAARTDFCSAGV